MPDSPPAGRIDLHAHYLTENYRAACIAAGKSQPDGMPELPRWSVAEAVQLMDDNNISAALLSVSSPGVFFGDVGAAVALAREINDEGASVVASRPMRFGLLASLPLPDVAAAVSEAVRALDTLRADGISLHTNYGGYYLGDESLEPLLAELDVRQTTVVLHPTSPAGWEAFSFGRPRPMIEFPLDSTRAVINLAYSRSFERFPQIRWVVPHLGGALPILADRAAGFAGRLAADGQPPIDLISTLRKLFYDLAGSPLPRALPALLSLVGIEQVVYGSDYPFTPAAQVKSHGDNLQATSLLTGNERAAIFRTNAVRLFPRLATS